MHLRTPIVATLAVLALATGGFDTVAAQPTQPPKEGAAEPPQLRREGRWLVDPQGRVVIVHGLNLVWKHAPYVPPATKAGFRGRDARWFKRHGFNGARVGTLWAGLTPDEPGVEDPTYGKRWQRVMDQLAQRRIWMMLDAHQDQWHETYGGEGVPDWAVIRPAPYNESPPVVAPFPTGYWTPEVSTVFDNFWADQDNLLTGWVDAWRIAAARWAQQPYFMGYDLLNEPWMGREWSTCLADGCQPSYAQELQPAMDRARAAIRETDPDNLVWWEPQQFAGGQKLDTFYEAVPGEEQLGFSWHNYCPDVFFESQGFPFGDVENCWEFARDRNQHALDQAAEMNAVPLMSEWGATDNKRAIEIDAAVADEHLMGWTHWAYKFWNDPTTADGDQGLFRDDADPRSVKKQKLRRLVRTYAQATAGTPLKMHFDHTDGSFVLRYQPDPGLTAPTRIFVSPLHYPRGYDVRVVGGRVVDQAVRRVLVEPSGTDPVTVRIVRKK